MSAIFKVLALVACTWIAIPAGAQTPRTPFRCGTTLDTSPALIRGKTFGYAAFGANSVLVIRVDFTNSPGAVSVEHVTNVLASVDAFYRATSFRQLSLSTVAVTPVLRLSGDAREYGLRPLQISAAARTAADAAGFNFNEYDFVIYTFPEIGFPYSGYGTIGGKGIWVPALDFVPVIVAHEFGHNLGLEHACSWTTPDDSLIGPGRAWDYGNSFDAMGNSPYFPDSGFNGNYRYLLGWLTDADIHTAQTNGTYRIHALDGENSLDWEKRYSLRIPAGAPFNRLLCDYWIDFRARFTYEHTRNGVLIQAATSGSAHFGNLLLDMTPGTDGQSDAALLVGQTFSDRTRGIFVTPISVDGKSRRYIDVVVNREVESNRPPALDFNVPLSDVAPRANVTFVAQSSDPEDDWLAYSWDFGDGTLPAQLNSRQVDKSWAGPGVFPVTCTVSDMKGGIARRTKVVRVGSPSMFHIAGRVLAGGLPVSGARVMAVNPAGHRRNCTTDDSGFYLLPNVADGVNTVRVFSPRYSFSNRSMAADASTTNVIFAAILPPPIPAISALTPGTARVGEPVTLAGTNFMEATDVRFGNIYAAFAVTSPTQIVAVVPPGAAAARVHVTTPAGTAVSPSEFFVDFTPTGNQAPSISRIEPPQAPIGSFVRIIGVNLSAATAVVIGSRVATFFVVSSSELMAVVPANSASANVVVNTPLGPAVSSSPLIVLPGEPATNAQPSIVTFNPRSGVEGTTVRILGANLGFATNVLLGGTPMAFSSLSAYEIHATIPSGALAANLVVQAPDGSAVSQDLFLLDVPRPLTISAQPQGATVNEGTTWTFTVTAYGAGPLRYQWKKDGVNLSATNATLILTNVTAADSGAYTVEIRNNAATATSDSANLEVLRLQDGLQQSATVWRTSPEAPWIAQSRVTLDYPLAAESASSPLNSWIESSVEGPVRLTFWWQLAAQRFDDTLQFSIDGTNYARLTGSTGWSRHIVELGAGTHVLRWTRRGSANALARLTQVTFEQTWFRQQPLGHAGLAGEPVTLFAEISGAASLQWFHDGIALAHGTNAALDLGSVQPANAGDYVLTLSNGLTVATSVVARVTAAPAAILQHPLSLQAVASSNVTLAVTFRSLVPTSVQWLFQTQALANATNAALVIEAMPATAGQYCAVISNEFGSVTSTMATVLVLANAPTLTGDAVVEYPAYRGENVVLTNRAIGAPPPTYVWTRNGRRIRGAMDVSLSIHSIRAVHRGIYAAIAENPFGSVTQQFRITVHEGAIVEQPQSADVWAGDPLRLTVLARSATSIRYQWRHGGVPIPGATNAELFISKARESNSGTYDVQIRTRHQRLLSTPAEITVRATAPSFLREPFDQFANAGDPATLSCEADGHPAPDFQWFFEGMALEQGHLPSITIPVLTTTWEGLYWVVISNEFGSATSAAARVSLVQRMPDPRIAPGDFDTVAGNWIVLRSTRAFSPIATNLQWLRTGAAIPNATNDFLLLPNISAGDSAKYRLRAQNGLGEGISSGTDIAVRSPGKLDLWHRRPPRPRTEDIRSTAYGNGIFVAVGESGTVLTSPYGSQWRDVSLLTTSTVASIAFSGGRFVALVEDAQHRGILVSSVYATNWSAVPLPAARRLRSVSSANERLIVAGEGMRTNLIVSVSTNGTSWVESQFSIPASKLSVAATTNRYVAVGATNVLISEDSLTWSIGPVLASSGVACGAGVFVAVGPAGTVWSSTDGYNWLSRASGTSKDLESIVFSQRGFVAVGEDGITITSTNGITWRAVRTDTSQELATACTDGDRVLAAGEAGAVLTFRGTLLETGIDAVSRLTLNGIVCRQGLFVAVGNRGLILTSPDGQSWTPRTSPTDKDLLSIAFADDQFVAAGENGRIIVSTNGLAWRAVNSPVTVNLTRVTVANDRWFALGEGSVLLESTNATNWAARSVPVPPRDAALGNLAFNHGLYVVAGGYHDENGFARSFIAVSQNAVSWVQQPDVNFGVKLRGIISYGEGFVVVGNDGLIATSVDGFRWRNQRLGTEGENLRAITVLPDGVLVAGGNRGIVCSSGDGTNWMRNRVVTSKNLHDLAFGFGNVVGVATDGLILTAEHVSPRLSFERASVVPEIAMRLEFGTRDQYRLQESDDLLNWRDVQVFNTAQSSNAVRTVAPNQSQQRFYRLDWH